MSENLYSVGQKILSEEGQKNLEQIFPDKVCSLPDKHDLSITDFMDKRWCSCGIFGYSGT